MYQKSSNFGFGKKDRHTSKSTAFMLNPQPLAMQFVNILEKTIFQAQLSTLLWVQKCLLVGDQTQLLSPLIMEQINNRIGFD